MNGTCATDASATIKIEGATNAEEGIMAEYAWLARNYRGWERESQALLPGKNGEAYDVFVMKRANEKATVCFDITDFFGKW